MTDLEPPDLSVVIAATDSDSAVALALEAIEGQAPGRIEILIIAEAGSSVPRLRRIGLEASTGRIVAFLEDNCLAQPGWAEAWIDAFADDLELVAGSGLVEHDDQGVTLIDRAVVFCEYAPFLVNRPRKRGMAPTGTGRCLSPFPGSIKGDRHLRCAAEPVPFDRPSRLAGNNFAVLREVALNHSATEVHETALLASIRGPVRMVETARVRHVRRFGWREAFFDRFRFGLEFGRLRTVEAGPLIRWAGLVAGPAIFGAQVVRLTVTILRNRRHLARFLQTLPITLALLASWSLGEWLGWSLGPPGRRLNLSTVRKPHEKAARPPGRPPGRAGSTRPGCTRRPPLA